MSIAVDRDLQDAREYVVRFTRKPELSGDEARTALVWAGIRLRQVHPRKDATGCIEWTVLAWGPCSPDCVNIPCNGNSLRVRAETEVQAYLLLLALSNKLSRYRPLIELNRSLWAS